MEDYNVHIPSSMEFFLKIWMKKLQQKIMQESNNYSNWIDHNTSEQKGGLPMQSQLILHEFKRFIGICALMTVRSQPSLKDY